ncbi:DeoR/GlpR family DNA-binding transcription regulator [Pseudooceanicola nanhaiensis]|uniref:DeoR/GlpR family DNA-binding transcription regulator n=1 Tax=Pseudooceanicola nanhaiensis TaxID=375761 RepID=UPI001CD1C8BE|nr:DeoR/GlpR family DNA-binding transcription regulator [Pseudooceanicola nanhaiensis]MCA0920768.1 DeoR/GlpR family DNA-binding transcription regulator [Pseudooceanicola nanhaiensis]
MASKSRTTRPGQRDHPAQARLAAIVARLESEGSVSLRWIAQTFGVSDMTVRRDLIGLEQEGVLKRVHGGAVPVPAKPAEGAAPATDPATEMARAAATELASARSVALDGSLLARRAALLAAGTRARFFTSSLRTADALARAGAEVYLPGGRIDGQSASVSGPAAASQFADLHLDVALLEIAGLTAEGAFDASFEDCALKQLYLSRARRRILLCPADALDQTSLIRLCPLSEIHVLITDAAPADPLVRALKAAGIVLRIARTT